MIWELDGLGLQHLIISIFSSKIFKDLLDSLCSRAHILRTLSNIQAGVGSCFDENFSLEVLNVLVLIYRFLLYRHNAAHIILTFDIVTYSWLIDFNLKATKCYA